MSMSPRFALTISILTANACGSEAAPPEERTLGSLDGSTDGARDTGAERTSLVDQGGDAPVAVDASMAVDSEPAGGDSRSPDISIAIGPATIGVGRPCQDEGGCGLGMFCLDEGEGWPVEGYCTLPGCATDAECGLDSLCSPPIGDQQIRLCLLKCDADKCSYPKHSCAPRVAGFVDIGRPVCTPGKRNAIDGAPCASFADCRGQQACLHNPFNAPDGMCVTLGCKPGDDTTCAPGGDAVCVPFMNTGLCFDTCTAPEQCRMATGWTCRDNPADPFPAFCVYPHKDPGAACTGAADCGPKPWECLTGTPFPGGNCGARGCVAGNDQTCPFDSRCHDPNPDVPNDQYCVRTCQTDADCRMAEGYKCSPLADGNGAKGCKQ